MLQLPRRLRAPQRYLKEPLLGGRLWPVHWTVGGGAAQHTTVELQFQQAHVQKSLFATQLPHCSRDVTTPTLTYQDQKNQVCI